MRCLGKVHYLDKVPRYTGRGHGGFEREWTWRSCKRPATSGDFCWQHQPLTPPPPRSPAASSDTPR